MELFEKTFLIYIFQWLVIIILLFMKFEQGK